MCMLPVIGSKVNTLTFNLSIMCMLPVIGSEVNTLTVNLSIMCAPSNWF